MLVKLSPTINNLEGKALIRDWLVFVGRYETVSFGGIESVAICCYYEGHQMIKNEWKLNSNKF